MKHRNSGTAMSLRLVVLTLMAVMMARTATAAPQFGNPQVVYTALPRGANTGDFPSQCNPACTRIFLPVCGTDGRTYGNLCILRFRECAYRNVSLAYLNECVPGSLRGGLPTQCPALCQAFPQPVCGSDGQTYTNLCILRIIACRNPSLGLTMQYEGSCAAPPGERTCPVACTAVYQPVCGSDGRTYGNRCVLESAACNDPTLTMTSQGECVLSPSASGSNAGQFPVDTPTRRIPGALNTPPPTFNDLSGGSCPNVCENSFNSPVCGSDGETYYNMCTLNLTACRENRTITGVSNGSCDGGGEVVLK